MRTGIEVDIDSRPAKRGSNEYITATERMAAATAKNTAKMRSDLSQTAKRLGQIGVAAAVFGGVALVRGIIRTTAEFEDLNITLLALEKTSARSAAAMERIQAVTTKTPESLQAVTQAYIQLRAQGLSATRDELTSLADLAAVFGEPITTVSAGIVSLIGGQTDTLKRMGLQLSITGDKIKVSFKDVAGKEQKRIIDNQAGAIAQLLVEYNKLAGFTGTAAKRADSFNGSISNLRIAMDLLLAKVGEGGLNDELSSLTLRLTEFAQSDEAAEMATQLATSFAKLARGLGRITPAVINNLDLLIAGIAGLATVGTLAKLRSMALSLNIYAKALLAVTAATVAFNKSNKNFLSSGFGQSQITKSEISKILFGSKRGIFDELEISTLFGPDAARAFADKIEFGRKKVIEDALAFYNARLGTEPTTVPVEVIVKPEVTTRSTAEASPLRGFLDPNTDENIIHTNREAEKLEKLFGDDIPTAAELMADTAKDAFNSIGDGIAQMVKGGKLDFAELANDIIAQMVRIFIQAQLLGLAQTIFGGSSSSNVVGTSTSLDTLGKGGVLPPSQKQVVAPSAQQEVEPPRQEVVAPLAQLAPPAAPILVPPSAQIVRPNNVSIVVRTQEGETAVVQERNTSEGLEIEVITEQIEAGIGDRANRGGGPFGPAVSGSRQFQR